MIVIFVNFLKIEYTDWIITNTKNTEKTYQMIDNLEKKTYCYIT